MQHNTPVFLLPSDNTEVSTSGVTFANEPILLKGSLVGIKGTESYLVRVVLFIIVPTVHGLEPNINLILGRTMQSLVENNRSTSHKSDARPDSHVTTLRLTFMTCRSVIFN